MLAIGCDRRVPTAAGPLRADELAAGLPRRAWQRLSAGPGAKGQRFYDWAWIAHPDPDRACIGELDDPLDTQCWWLLVRRHRHTGELAFYRCYSPEPVPLRELVRVAGRRWTVEEAFQAGKGLAGLDEHQVRRWTSWQRWTLLAMIAHALLAVLAATSTADRPAPAGLIALTCNEIRRLFTVLIVEPARALACPLAWSTWRRRHQHRARTSHYQRQTRDRAMNITIYGWSTRAWGGSSRRSTRPGSPMSCGPRTRAAGPSTDRSRRPAGRGLDRRTRGSGGWTARPEHATARVLEQQVQAAWARGETACRT